MSNSLHLLAYSICHLPFAPYATYESPFNADANAKQSLWSTTDTFNFNALAYTMILVALTTYIIVFNLRSMVDATQSRYLRWKNNLVREMKGDKNRKWQATGERFERFRSRLVPKDTRPSEWSIAAFYVRKVLGINKAKKVTRIPKPIADSATAMAKDDSAV